MATPDAKDKPPRADMAIKAGAEMPSLEDWEGAKDIADALLLAGPSEAGGFGEAPLTWREIHAWLALTEASLSPGDLETLRELSRVYVSACQEYREKNVPAPYRVGQSAPAGAQDALRKALDSLVSSNGKRKVKGK